MLKKKSFVRLMNILKAQSERRDAMAEAFGAMYNFVPERECIMSHNDAECVILDLIGDNGAILEWLKKEMHDQYEYIDWFVCECEYGKDPKRLYIPDDETKITNIYLVDNPAMVFDIITNPNFGRENTVTVENVRKYKYALVHNNEEKTYVVLGLRDSNDGNKCIVLLEDTFNELVYTQRQSGRFVLDGEPDDSDKFIEQLTNQIFLDNDKKNS